MISGNSYEQNLDLFVHHLIYDNTFMCISKELGDNLEKLMRHKKRHTVVHPYIREYCREILDDFVHSISVPNQCTCGLPRGDGTTCQCSYVEYMVDWIKRCILSEIGGVRIHPRNIETAIYDSCIMNAMAHIMMDQSAKLFHDLRNKLYRRAHIVYQELMRVPAEF